MGIWYEVFNTALLISADEPVQIFHKSQLVPGAEMTPYHFLFKPILEKKRYLRIEIARAQRENLGILVCFERENPSKIGACGGPYSERKYLSLQPY